MSLPEPSRTVNLEDGFVEALLRRAGDMAEIKLVLEVARIAAASDSARVPLERLTAPEIAPLVVGAGSPEPAEERVHRVVERAVADGLLHRIGVLAGGSRQEYLLLATSRNDRLVSALRDGSGSAESELGLPEGDEVLITRPNIFSLYERHIGPLTPLIAEHLRAAERAYPRDWLEAAILQSVEYNARSWRYVDTILQRWEAEGGPGVTVR